MGRKKGSTLTPAQKLKSCNAPPSPETLAKYLELYSSGTPSGDAAALVGMTLTTVSRLKEQDPAFLKAWQKAYDGFTDVLEKRAEQMALNCPHNSPTMIIFMLKARRPAVYRENVKMEHSGQVTFAADFAQAMSRVDNGIPAVQH